MQIEDANGDAVRIGDGDPCGAELTISLENLGAAASRLAQASENTIASRRRGSDYSLYMLVFCPAALVSSTASLEARVRLGLVIEKAQRCLTRVPAISRLACLATMAQLRRQQVDSNKPTDDKAPTNDNLGDYYAACREWLKEAVREETHTALDSREQADLERAIGDELCRADSPLRARATIRDLLVDRWFLRSGLSIPDAVKAECLYAGKRRQPLLLVTGALLALTMALFLIAGLAHLSPGYKGPTDFSVWTGSAVALLSLVSWPRAGRVWIPRLAAVSFLGYLGLLQAPFMFGMNDANRPTWQPWLLIAIIVSCLIYFYQGEVTKHVRGVGVPLFRSLLLLFIGLAHSWIVGAVGYYTVIYLFRLPHVNEPIFWQWGPIALFLGLIVQSLWERDVITEPI